MHVVLDLCLVTSHRTQIPGGRAA